MDAEYPLVSLVTPVYNGEKYLAECIESVLVQDYPHIEYIVINDGSTDGSEAIILNYLNQVTYIKQPNQGQAKTLNRGWQMSKGHYLTYLSADDKLLPGAISALVKFIQKEKDAVVVYPDCDLIDFTRKIVKKSVVKPFDYRALLVDQDLYIGVCPLFSRKLFDMLHGWRENLRLAPDRDFWLRAAQYGKLLMYPETLGLYRVHADSTSFKLSDIAAALEYIEVIHYLKNKKLILPQYEHLFSNALANAHFFAARIHFRAGRWREAQKHLQQAKKINLQFNYQKAYLFLFKYGVGLILRKLKWRMSEYFNK
jgi:glycosyltransferase involved in cell wall biosynthesis